MNLQIPEKNNITKVQQLRQTDAPVKEIRQLQKEKAALYDELNAKRNEIYDRV